MNNSFIQKTLTGLLAVALVGIAFQTRAQDNKTAEAKPEAKAATKKLPFGGTLSAVDKSAMTLSVKKKESEKTYQITSTTKFTKGGKPATLDDGVVGEPCGGSYIKTDDGKLEVASIRFGPKPEQTDTKKSRDKKATDASAPEKN